MISQNQKPTQDSQQQSTQTQATQVQANQILSQTKSQSQHTQQVPSQSESQPPAQSSKVEPESQSESSPLKEHPSLKTIFTDEKSPYFSAPLKIQALLKQTQQNQKVNFKTLNLQKLGFQPKPTRTNFCSHFIKLNGIQQYIICKACIANSVPEVYFCYCQSCFVPEMHEGHEIQRKTLEKGYCYCDCGRVDRIKKQALCPKHKQYDQIIECEIKEEDRKQFVEAITALLQCAVYCNFNGRLLYKIFQYLCQLNEGSVYYNRLTYQILIQKSKVIDKNKINKQYIDIDCFYFIMLTVVKKSWELQIHFCSDLQTKKNFIKFICGIFDRGGTKTLEKYLDSLNLEELFENTVLWQLVQEGFHHKLIENYCIDLPKQKLDMKFFIRFMENRIRNIKNMAEIREINYKMIVQPSQQLLLLKIIQIFPTRQNILQFIQIQQLIKNPNFNFDVKKNKIRLSYLPKEVELALMVILELLFLLSNNERSNIRNVRKFLLDKGVSAQKLDQIIEWIIIGITYELGFLNLDNMTNMNIIILLYLIKGSPKQTQFIESMWDRLFECLNPEVNEKNSPTKQLSTCQIFRFADVFHFTVALILRSDLNILLIKNAVKHTLNEEEFQYIQNWFRSFLYERRFLPRNDMMNIKSYGYLQFKTSTEILNQLCYYNEEQQRFQYNSPKIFKNISNKFPLIPSKNAYGTIYRNQGHFGQDPNLGDNTLAKQLIVPFLSAKNIVNLIDEEWSRYMRCALKNDGQYFYGLMYIFILVYIDTLTYGAHKELRERLELLRSDPTLLGTFSNIEIQLQLISRMLLIPSTKSPEKPINSQEIQQTPEQRKAKAQEKKKKLKQKFEANNKQILQKAEQQSLQSRISEEEQICILCHEKQKLNNQLVYICNINANMTLATAVYGDDNATRTYISSCYHAFHVNCFTSYRKQNNFNFNCPLCQKVNNCILPIAIHKENVRLSKICENAKIACVVAMTQSFKVDSNFLIIFKHLVESKGLNSVVQKQRYKENRKIWAKNDDFLQNLLISIYQNATQKKKATYIEEIDKLIEVINKCPRHECKIIQLLFAQLFKQIVVSADVEVNTKLLTEIRSTISEEDYYLIKEQVDSLVLDTVILQPEEQTEETKMKINMSVNLVQLPKNALECYRKYKEKCKCGEQSLVLCLICSNLSCLKCSHQHSEGHRGISFNLLFSNFKIVLLCKTVSANENVYENELKLPLEQAIKVKGTQLNAFNLNEVKFEKLAKQFMEN